MLGLQLLEQFALQRVCGNSRSIGHSSVNRSEGAGREGERGRMNSRAEEVSAASAQDGERGGAGEH